MSRMLTHSEIVSSVHATLSEQFTKAQVKQILDAHADLVRQELLNGGGVLIRRCVKLTTKTAKARTVHNPRSPDKGRWEIPERRVPTAKFLGSFKDEIAGV